MIKAAFFDIDGTLIDFSTRTAPLSAIESLETLREKGIKIFISTGRPPIGLGYLRERIPTRFDGFVTMNGQYCYMGNTVVRDAPIPKEDIAPLLPYLEESGVCCAFSELDYTYFNQESEGFRRVKERFGGGFSRPFDDPARIFTHDTYQLNLYLLQEEEGPAMARIPNCRAVRWNPLFSDIIPRQGGKAAGLRAMLARFGIDPSEAIAFGDGGNDIEMLEAVGYGVAMGNGEDEVKARARYVTAHIQEDGVKKALEHFSVLP